MSATQFDCLEWVRVNRAKPCPVCQRTHYCSVSTSGEVVFCTKVESDRPSKDGTGWLHVLAEPVPRLRVVGGAPRPKAIGTTRYGILNAAAELVAVHVRVDYEGGEKKVWWEQPDGKTGLGNLNLSDLPLYGIEDLRHAPDGATVVVTEGEKARDALHELGVRAVGTVTGAGTTPVGVAPLRDLARFDVALWPDNDAPGAAHMAQIRKRLVQLGIPVRTLVWPDAPPKGDAADFVDAGLGKDALNAMYAAAEPAVNDPETAPEPPEEEEPPASAFHLTDLGNAARLVARHGPNIRWCDAMGQWFQWSGAIWQQAGPTALQDLAKETALSIYDEATDPDLIAERRDALFKHAARSSSARSIASMVALAKTTSGGIAVDADALDADQMLLGVENGVVDLRTGAFREATREDLITRACRAPFDATAECPLWLAFLERIFDGDAELIAYVQRIAGYSITGQTGERVIFILHGSGANGKSTMVEVIGHILNTYATTTPIETLIAKKDRGIPNDVARLKSARYVTATESERGHKLAEAFIKLITGGDRVAARFLHKEFFEFTPRLKLWLSTNHRPEISGGGKAIWTRIRLIPFLIEIPIEERDPDLKAKLIAEAPGILRWLIQGCLEWQRIGLREPASVKDANKSYEEDEDTLGAWVEARAVVEPHVWCSAADLYGSFKDWAEAHGEERMSAKAFSQALAERRGIKRARQGARSDRGFSGIRLRDPKANNQKDEDEE